MTDPDSSEPTPATAGDDRRDAATVPATVPEAAAAALAVPEPVEPPAPARSPAEEVWESEGGWVAQDSD